MRSWLSFLPLLVSSSTLLAAGCAATLPAPTEADALRASQSWPGTTVATLDAGRSLYRTHCSACHALYAPSSQTAAFWRRQLEEMAPRAKLSRDEAEMVVRYLMTAAGPSGAPAGGTGARPSEAARSPGVAAR